MRLLAALSGGVDSAVAAALCVAAGHDVTAVHLALAPSPSGPSGRAGPAAAPGGRAHGCCTPEDARDARRVADVLDIPYFVWDLAERFARDVVADFVASYAAGATPNPCLRCNERIKFAAVADRARGLGFDGVVTGHYARLDAGVLGRAADRAKDQSYVLGTLRPDQLARAHFPLGGLTKPEVRAVAAERGLAVAAKPDSHDICFIADGDTRGYLRRAIGDQPGPVLDARTGAVLGEHDGAYAFTVGQRHGLGLSRPAPDGRPRYVLAVTPVDRSVTVGPLEDLAITGLCARDAVWSGRPAPAPGEDVACRVQVRAHGASVPATARTGGGPGELTVTCPGLAGVAPGQAAVLYAPDDQTVLGGAWITSTTA